MSQSSACIAFLWVFDFTAVTGTNFQIPRQHGMRTYVRFLPLSRPLRFGPLASCLKQQPSTPGLKNSPLCARTSTLRVTTTTFPTSPSDTQSYFLPPSSTSKITSGPPPPATRATGWSTTNRSPPVQHTLWCPCLIWSITRSRQTTYLMMLTAACFRSSQGRTVSRRDRRSCCRMVKSATQGCSRITVSQ